MELYSKEAEKAQRLLPSQGLAISQYLSYFKENFLMVNGKVSTMSLLVQ